MCLWNYSTKIDFNIRNLNQQVGLHNMMITLRQGSIIDSLCKKSVVDLD